MPGPNFDGHRTLHLNNVPQKLLEEIRSMSEDDFMEKAAENGWDDDYEFLKTIYDRLHDFDEPTPDNAVYKAAANILTRDLSSSKFKDAHKADLVNYTTGKENFMFYRNRTARGYEFRDTYDRNVTSDENNNYRDSQDEKEITSFDYAYDPNAVKNSWVNGKMAFLDKCGKEIWTSPEERQLLGMFYDVCAATGRLDEDLSKTLTRFNTLKGDMTDQEVVDIKKSCIQDFRNQLFLKSVKTNPTQLQTSAIANADKYLNETIPVLYDEAYSKTPEGMRENWVKTAFKNHEYVHGAYDTLRAIYDATSGAPQDSALGRLRKAFETGRPEGYDEKTMHDQPALVTSMLLDDAKKVLGEAEKTAEVNKALNAISEYEKLVSKGKTQEAADLPQARVFNAITEEEQRAIHDLADTMQKTENRDGAGLTAEFNNMIQSMKSFSHTALGPIGSINGMFLKKAMTSMDQAIEQFIASEKQAKGEDYTLNPNVGLAAKAMDTVNPFRAAEHKAEIAQNLFQNLSNTKKEWYDRKNTTEYTTFLNSLKTFQNLKPGDEGYQKASDDLKRDAMDYISRKKGGLTVDAHQAGGDARRKMAILSVALVDMKAAQQMVDEANKIRATKGLKEINLKELALKEGFGELVKDKIDHSKATVKAEPKTVKEAPELGGPKLPGMK